eukprot:4593991-Pyramimonas_sp.AAC.1
MNISSDAPCKDHVRNQPRKHERDCVARECEHPKNHLPWKCRCLGQVCATYVRASVCPGALAVIFAALSIRPCLLGHHKQQTNE